LCRLPLCCRWHIRQLFVARDDTCVIRKKVTKVVQEARRPQRRHGCNEKCKKAIALPTKAGQAKRLLPTEAGQARRLLLPTEAGQASAKGQEQALQAEPAPLPMR
jgi:hypothetical protein